MPRPAGTAKYPLTVGAAVDAALKQRLDLWAQHQDVTPSALIRALIKAHVPDLRRLAPQRRPAAHDQPPD